MQIQVEIATANSNQLSGEKGFCCSPEYKLLFAPHSNGNMNSLTLIHFFTLAELGYKLENTRPKKSSQKCQLRMLVLPNNFNCTQRTVPHTPKFGMWFPLLGGGVLKFWQCTCMSDKVTLRIGVQLVGVHQTSNAQ